MTDELDTARPLSGERVLIVEDHEDAADLLAWLLKDLGAKTRVANSAVHIAQIVQEFDPELVLMDLGLPEVDGFEACRVIRSIKGRTVFVAAVTGWCTAEHSQRCEQEGFDAYIAKPMSADLVIGLVTEAVDRLKAPAVSAAVPL